ncbi:MAG: iron-containing redox enzyme family protein [Planctomycetes bacterium]|nr:iron-containing redox enzyme family protein [Planctomycetota bacterium]
MSQLETATPPASARPLPAWLSALRAEVASHPAVNHLLLARLATGPYTKSDYKSFGLQHYALVGFFTRYMEVLLMRAPTSAEKLWLAKVLVNEYGEGSDGLDHTQLYRKFLTSAGTRVNEEFENELCPEAFAFVREHLRICREEPFLVGLGALGPGHEWAIPKMFSHLIPGLRRARFEESEILYFTLHCEQDLDHGAWMTEVLAEQAQTREQQEQVRRGALLSLEARFRFWTGVERRIVQWRQPEAVKAVAHGVYGGSKDPARLSSPGKLADLKRLATRYQEGGVWAP